MLVARRRLPLLARSLASPASSWITRTTCATRRTASTAASPASETGIQVADPLLLYFSLVAQGKIKKDEEQLRALVQIRKLHADLLDYQPPVQLVTLLDSIRSLPSNSKSESNARSALSNLGEGLSESEEQERQRLLALSDKEKTTQLVKALKAHEGLEDLDTPKGFLLTGPPGTGKSLLMDLFFQSLPVASKTRHHYHAFLLWIYQGVHRALEKQRLENEAEEKAMNELYQANGNKGYPWSRREEMKARAISQGWQSVFAGGRSAHDPALNTREFVLAQVALDLIKTQGWLLAFDEIQLVDIAGAGLVSRVMSWYWRLGGVVVGTSNRVPEDLYKQGIQRSTLSPFLTALSHRAPVIDLTSPTDYRLVSRAEHGLTPETDAAEPGDFGSVDAWKRWGTRSRGWFVKGEIDDEAWNEALRWIAGDVKGEATTLSVYGRQVKVPWAAGGVARFSFKDLCEQPLGPADYISIGSAFHTIIIDDVPVLPLSAKNEARRLITLLDALYESKTRLLARADAPIDSLFFPDAVNAAASAPQNTPLDDLPTTFSEHEGSQAPGTSAQDAAGEVADSLVEEMLGDVQQDLDAPYRPNVSSYDQSAGVQAYERDRARAVERAEQEEQVARQLRARREQEGRAPIHPSAATPSFQSLAIFTGEEERFAFKRAVSRVHEMSSTEYLVTAQHSPLPSSIRTWEQTIAQSLAPLTPNTAPAPSLHVMGEKSPLSSTDRLSGVLDPADLRAKWPEGMPTGDKQVDVRGSQKPVLREEHVWGVRDDWGKKAGRWGKGAKAYSAGED
ncbi:hypothetical protein RHOSPDRAFT_23715 [Rhodotorula sp. JG-1b]|nr:hypothetical protein RHOSPDRAFT_23715 [Rhodotorula sp. JG-1b]